MTTPRNVLCVPAALLALLIAGCVPVTPVPSSVVSDQSPVVSQQGSFSATVTPGAAGLASEVAATPAPLRLPPPLSGSPQMGTFGEREVEGETATPAPVVGLCSPLAVTPWEDLWKIDWQPFTMPSHYEGTKFRDNGHPGVDLVYYSRYGRAGIVGEGVQSVMDSTVASIITNRMPYGNMVMTETVYDHIPPELLALIPIPPGDSLYIVYAHLRDLSTLELGQPVTCGQAFGHVGNTGLSTGGHLHFETRWGPPGAQFPSMSYYTADYTDEEVDNYVLWRMSGIYIPFDPMTLLTLKLPASSSSSSVGRGQ